VERGGGGIFHFQNWNSRWPWIQALIFDDHQRGDDDDGESSISVANDIDGVDSIDQEVQINDNSENNDK
jgi:hypothetical protein